MSALEPCAQEDSVNCYWNANVMGNGSGQSFTSDADGNITYWADDCAAVDGSQTVFPSWDLVTVNPAYAACGPTCYETLEDTVSCTTSTVVGGYVPNTTAQCPVNEWMQGTECVAVPTPPPADTVLAETGGTIDMTLPIIGIVVGLIGCAFVLVAAWRAGNKAAAEQEADL